MINSRLGLFTAAHSREHPLFRSYGVNLPSSLTTLLPLALEFSSWLPGSVCGTGATSYTQSFSRLLLSMLPYSIFGPFRPGLPTPGSCPSKVSLCLNLWRLRNLHRMCIDYAFRPRLSSRLTRSGRTFLLKPEAFGHYDSHIILATHSGILTCMQSTAAFATTSPRIQRSPTIHNCHSSLQFILTDNLASLRAAVCLLFIKNLNDSCVSQASVYNLAPLNFRRRITRPVSYYALF